MARCAGRAKMLAGGPCAYQLLDRNKFWGLKPGGLPKIFLGARYGVLRTRYGQAEAIGGRRPTHEGLTLAFGVRGRGIFVAGTNSE